MPGRGVLVYPARPVRRGHRPGPAAHRLEQRNRSVARRPVRRPQPCAMRTSPPSTAMDISPTGPGHRGRRGLGVAVAELLNGVSVRGRRMPTANGPHRLNQSHATGFLGYDITTRRYDTWRRNGGRTLNGVDRPARARRLGPGRSRQVPRVPGTGQPAVDPTGRTHQVRHRIAESRPKCPSTRSPAAQRMNAHEPPVSSPRGPVPGALSIISRTSSHQSHARTTRSAPIRKLLCRHALAPPK